MPTVMFEGPYSFVFFSPDRGEPPHIHVKRGRMIAKSWFAPVDLAKSRGFPGHELNRIARIVVEQESVLSEAWREYFGA